MTGFGLPFSFSAFVGVGGKTDEGGYLFSTQAAEFRQVGDECCGDDRADAAHGAQDLRQAMELPIAGDVTLDRLFNGLKALGERSDDEGQALADERVVRQIGAAAFGLPGVDKLSAPGGQRPQALVSAKRRRQIGAPSRVSEIAGDQHGVDPIGLGAHAASLAKGEDGVGVELDVANAGFGKSETQGALITAGRLHGHKGRSGLRNPGRKRLRCSSWHLI